MTRIRPTKGLPASFAAHEVFAGRQPHLPHLRGVNRRRGPASSFKHFHFLNIKDAINVPIKGSPPSSADRGLQQYLLKNLCALMSAAIFLF